MGFYIRKSFRAGPIRLNLSKSGLGASIGVKGARISTSPGGRSYMHAGRGGLYYRAQLGRSSSGGGTGQTGSSSGGTIVIEEETDATYSALHEQSQPTRTAIGPPKPEYHLGAAALGYPLFVLASLATVSGVAAANPESKDAISTAGAAAMALLGVAWAPLLIRQATRARRGRGFAKQLRESLHGPAPAPALQSLQAETKATPEAVAFEAAEAHREYLHTVIADRIVEDDELERIAALELAFEIPAEIASASRLSAFRSAYVDAVSDHDLTHEEERQIHHIRKRLDIPESAVREALDTISRLAEIREIRGGDLPQVETGRRLQRDEICFFEDEGRIVKRRSLQTFRRDGQRYKVEGLVIDKEGDLLLTNKRLLFVHEGTSSIKLDKIMDIEVDLDRNLITITKDGVQRPVLVTTPDAQRAGAVLAAAAKL